MPVKRYGIHNATQSRFVVDEQATLWRYIDTGKYLDLLTTCSLWLTRVKELQKIDPYESNITQYDYDMLRRVAAATSKPELRLIAEEYGYRNDDLFVDVEPPLGFIQAMFLKKIDLTGFYSNCCSISCWHENDQESDAMWALYAHREAGIAVKSSVRRLIDAFSKSSRDMDIAKVIYDTEGRASALTSDIYSPLLIKRPAFQHEHEVRLITRTFDGFDQGRSSDEFVLDYQKQLPPGVAVECALDTLIDEVVLSPLMPRYFANAVTNITAVLAPDLKVRPSLLLTPPQWQIDPPPAAKVWLNRFVSAKIAGEPQPTDAEDRYIES
jgi:hypothetical protein